MSVPSERRVSSKWGEVGYLLASHSLAGLALGALSSVVVFRAGSRLPMRAAMSFFGAGVGTGLALSKANDIMQREVRVE